MQSQTPSASEPAFYARAVVLAKTTWSSTTLWREIKAGRFPKAVQISQNRVAWNRDDVDQWIQEKMEASHARVA